MYIYVYIYICIHIHIYMYTYIYMCIHISPCYQEDAEEAPESPKEATADPPAAGFRVLGGPKDHVNIRIPIWYIVYGIEYMVYGM